MTGEQVIAHVKTLNLGQLTVLRQQALKGLPNAVALWVAYGAVKKCQQDGLDDALLAPILDQIKLKVEIV